MDAFLGALTTFYRHRRCALSCLKWTSWLHVLQAMQLVALVSRKQRRDREGTICWEEGWGRFRRSPSGLGPALEVVKRDATMHTRSLRGSGFPEQVGPVGPCFLRFVSSWRTSGAEQEPNTSEVKRNAVYYDETTTLANFRGRPLFLSCKTTLKQHLNGGK